MTTYHARVELGDRFWLVYVEEIDRWTQARHLREVREMARDLVAVMEDVDPDSFELDVTTELPKEVQKHLAEAQALRDDAAAANARAAAEARAAARLLAERGMPLRDIGAALGVSYQRAHQLVSAPSPTAAGDVVYAPKPSTRDSQGARR